MKKLLPIALCALFPTLSNAAPFYCKVNINNVLLYADGSVNVRHTGRADFTYICNLNTERQGVPITTCAMWASLLSNLQKDNLQARFYYNGTSAYNSCSTLPTYNGTPAPVYIGTVE